MGRGCSSSARASRCPFALQGLYLVAYRFASGLGAGPRDDVLLRVPDRRVPRLGHRGVGRRSSRRCRSRARARRRSASRGTSSRSSWLSLAVVAAAAGVFALAGETVVRRVLGSSYGGGTGAELGRLVVYLAPWMVASVALTVAYPLVFVRGRARWLPLLAGGALLVQVLVDVAAAARGVRARRRRAVGPRR